MPLPKPSKVRFQTSQRGVRFKSLAEAKEDFLTWLDTGESPRGADTKVHIWQNGKERILDQISNDPRGENLRTFLRGALRTGKLQIRKIGKNRE